MQVEQKVLDILFPQYKVLFAQQQPLANQQLEHFITNELPGLINTVESIQSVFMKLQSVHSNLILKSTPTEALFQAFIRKVAQKTEGYINNMDKLVIVQQNEHFDYAYLRKEIREQFLRVQDDIIQKYVKNKSLNRTTQQYVAQCIYRIIQYYTFTKSDTHNIASKYQLKSSNILSSVKSSIDPASINQLVIIDPQFKINLQEFVQKRMRPFLQKKDLLNNKIKDILKQNQPKYQTQNKNILKSILTKQKTRCQRQIYSSLQKQLKNKSIPKSYHQQPLELNNQMNHIKSQFQKMKSNPYYLQIIRGTFKLTFGNETQSLQNLFGMCRLQEFLINSSKLTERMTQLIQKMIDFRKNMNLEIGIVLENAIDECVYQLEGKDTMSLSTLVLNQFDRLKQLLATSNEAVEQDKVDRFKLERVERQEQRNKKIAQQRQKKVKENQRRKQQLEQKTQKQKQIKQQKKRADEEKRTKQMSQLKQKQDKRKMQQAARLSKFKQQKSRLDEQRLARQDARKQQQAERKQKLEQEKLVREKQRQQKARKIQQQKQRVLDEDKRKKYEQDQRKRKLIQQKKIQQQKLEQKKRVQQQQKQQQVRLKKQQQARKKLQLQEQANEKKRSQQLRKQKQKQRADQQLKQKQQKKKLDQQKKQQQLAVAEKKKKDDQAKKIAQQQQKQRKLQDQKQKRQKQIEIQNKRKQEQRLQKIRLQQQQKYKKQLLKQQKQRQDRQKQQNDRKQKFRIQQQKKQKQLQAKKQRQLEQKKKEQQEKQRKRIEQEKQKQKKRIQQQQKQRIRRQQQQQKQKQKLKEVKRREDQKKRIQKQKQQEEERMKKQKEQQKIIKQKSSKKGGKKESQFNYDDMYEDDFEPEQDIEKQKKKGGKKPTSKDDDFDFLDEDIDFPDDGEEGEDENQLMPQQLITLANIKSFNDAIKSTQYVRKNKPNIEMFNNMKHFAVLFEQFIQNHQLFVFSDDVANKLYQTFQKDDEENTFPQQIKQIATLLINEYCQMTESQDLDLSTKYYFIFTQDNMMGLKLLQLQLGEATQQEISLPKFTFFLSEKINEQTQNLLGRLTDILCMIFGIQLEQQQFPDMEVINIPKESLDILQTMQNYLPPMILLFNWMYEVRNPHKQIIIDQYTVQRFFYSSHALLNLYPLIQTSEKELDNFYDTLYQKYNSDPDVQVRKFIYSSQQAQELAKMALQFKNCLSDFSKSNNPSKYLLVQFVIQSFDQQGNLMVRFSLYLELGRDPNIYLKFYILAPDPESHDFLSNLFENIVGSCQKEVESYPIEVYVDFTRHNGLYEYYSWSLPAWAQIITKRKMLANDAMVVLNFSMLPLLSIFKGQD